MSIQFYVPDLLANWPWPRVLNPYFEEVKHDSSEWTRSFNAFSPKAQRAFDLCDFNLVAALGFPFLDKARLRTAADLMNAFFVFDDFSDIADERTVREQADMIMDALRNPHKPRPQGESVLGEIYRQFWELAIQTASPGSQRRFIDSFQDYTNAVVQEARDRDRNHRRTIEGYLAIRRRGTVGVFPSFAMIELDMDIPDEVIKHPVISDLENWVEDMSIISNDIVSYNVEQSRGQEEHNIVHLAMRDFNFDLHAALKWAADYHEDLAQKFLAAKDSLPSFGDELVDSNIARYVDGLGRWVRALDCWNFESHRYFGDNGVEIQKTRIATLLPKREMQKQAPRVQAMLCFSIVWTYVWTYIGSAKKLLAFVGSLGRVEKSKTC